MSEKKDSKNCLISFSIGPVQSFISTARTVRDLWSGSYLLSWLTAHAAKAAIEMGGDICILEPDLRENALYGFVANGRGSEDSSPGDLLVPSLPNRFIAELSGDAAEIDRGLREAVTEEWGRIAEAVRDHLKKQWDDDDSSWAAQWDEQIENCWDLRTGILPPSDGDLEAAEQLGFKTTEGDPKARLFKARLFLLGRLDAARKQVRHYPPHEQEGCHRPKCALCGERSQQIPTNWESRCQKAHIEGDRLHENDRFCAVALVKRFAWAAYFKKKIGCEWNVRRVWDTYTIAALDWLRETGVERPLDWVEEQRRTAAKEDKHWNGCWLTWRSPQQDKEEKEADHCPEGVWDEIQERRKAAKDQQKPGTPPSYYAILMLDGDKMGEKLKKADQGQRSEISHALARFAQQTVPDLVREHLGQLIYAGGDDVLAMLPRETALSCAKVLADAFSKLGKDFTLSGGIAVVHAKHDLRDALDAARAAEHTAKEAGRNQIALCVVKRSSERDTADVGWEQVETLQSLRDRFADPAVSDRWLYRLAGQWETLESDPAMLDAEFRRLLHRGEKAPVKEAQSLWEAHAQDVDQDDGQRGVEQRKTALTLMQHAAFLARAKED